MSDQEEDQARRDLRLSDEAIDWLVHLSSGRATEHDREAYLSWRTRSPEHEQAACEAEGLLRDIEATQAADRLLGPVGFSAGASNATPTVSSSLVRAMGWSVRQPLARRAMLGGAAAVAVVAVTAGLGVLGPVASLYADHATAVGERKRVALPDGSVAFLNTATALSVDYCDAYRRIDLYSGEAEFEVAKDATRPFVVAARGAETRAVGTVFTVRCCTDETDVTVSEGTVEVKVGVQAAVRLDAGQHLSYDEGGARRPEPVDIEAATAWRRGKLIFNRRPLQEVVAEIGRYRPGRIVILDDKLKSLQITGVFDLDDPETLLRSLATTATAQLVRLPLLTLIR